MPYGRCPTQSANAGVLAGSLFVALIITKNLSDYFNPSSTIIDQPSPVSDMPALAAVPRSMGPVSTYLDYLEMLQTNNTQCFPTEAPLDPTTKLSLALGLMFALLAKVFETAFDLASTFSPLLNDFIAKPLFAATVLGSFLSACMLWRTREAPMLPAWYLARMTFPALVHSMLSGYVDRLVQHLFGRNTTSTTAEQTENRSEHLRRRQKLVLLTMLALTRILLEFLLRFAEDLLQLPPSPQQGYHLLVFKLSALCTVPVFEYLEAAPMRSSLTAAIFILLHDTIDWLNVCISESPQNPFQALVIDILDIPKLREAIFVLGLVVNFSADAWVRIQQHTYYRRFEQFVHRATHRCKMSVRPIHNKGTLAILVFGIILEYLVLRRSLDPNLLRTWETERQDFLNTLPPVNTLQRLFYDNGFVARRLRDYDGETPTPGPVQLNFRNFSQGEASAKSTRCPFTTVFRYFFGSFFSVYSLDSTHPHLFDPARSGGVRTDVLPALSHPAPAVGQVVSYPIRATLRVGKTPVLLGHLVILNDLR
ncbi:hypothetical protein BC567DRAFT_265116 [Phyllosticta citribraziliensis]